MNCKWKRSSFLLFFFWHKLKPESQERNQNTTTSGELVHNPRETQEIVAIK